VTHSQASVTKRLMAQQRRVAQQPAPEVSSARYRAGGVKSHRDRLGLSALNFGKLVGVSGLTIYSWESGKSKLRAAQVAQLAAVRKLDKRAAIKRLELLQ
jgi:DNA-binding transcriptional regulator YiaG